MTGWLRRVRQQAIKREEQKFVESMRPGSKGVWMVPITAPCRNCIQTPGNAICKHKCSYYPKLIEMVRRGELMMVIKK